MPIDSDYSFISTLEPANPLANDPRSEGDDHIRGIKTAVQGSFPNFVGAAVTSTEAELNILDGVTSTAAELNILDGVTATFTELNYNDITTLGTAQASKVLTASAGSAFDFNNFDMDNVDIDSGAIDGVTIGAAVAATITGAALGAAVTAVTAAASDDDTSIATTAFANRASGDITSADVTNISVTFGGGLIVKFGYELVSGSSTSVTFGSAFPSNCWWAGASTYVNADTGGLGTEVGLRAIPTTSGLDFSTVSTMDRIYWIAIGN